ncbi:MAG: magnesium-translocating P-type ATPase [Betaproteobacteria bacterium]|nr:magnesium-translocating P-type ATPase [Betaproteobacteria bacterium]
MAARDPKAEAPEWWRETPAALAQALGSGPQGLGEARAREALERYGPNVLVPRHRRTALAELLLRFRNPLVLLLVAAAAVSAGTGDVASALIVVAVLAASVTLDFVQERRAGDAVERLRALVRLTATAIRDGAEREVPAAELVPGDAVRLAAGDLVPADGVLLAARDLYLNQATLTGEPFPAEKHAAARAGEADSPADCDGVALMGGHVVSGTATLLVVRTGAATQLGGVAGLIEARARPNPLEIGARRFGLMILRLTVFMVLFVLLVNALAHRPLLESFMFAVALAVGLTPELLPMIVSVTLARGALRMAAQEAIVKQPAAIYSLGALDMLATDKTGTLTEGRIELERHLDAEGADSERVLELAFVNSAFETGLKSPLDQAILRHRHIALEGWRKVDEVPFDFERRRVSVLADAPEGERLLIVKGAPEELLARCDRYARAGGDAAELDGAARGRAQALFESLGEQGMRVLAICWREVERTRTVATVGDEEHLTLAGFAAFLDPPRADARAALAELAARGVAVKILTGDNERVASHLCTVLGLRVEGVLLGRDIERLDFEALATAAQQATLFCRVSPAQKTRIIAALRQRGHAVGFMGDGINDAPALRGADVGISVDGAVDVAKEAADVILQRHDLMVLLAAIVEGRRTHGNIMKYLRMGTSSNFGNMFSMAGATLFLPFLPLLPVQVLLNNLLYDLSEIPIPFDRVEDAETRSPRTWNLAPIRSFMLVFGPLSSLFDFLTFGLLLWAFHAGQELFRTGWFVESVASQVLVIFLIRGRAGPFAGRPHPGLVAAALAVVAAAALLPFTPAAAFLGFAAPPAPLVAAISALVARYLLLVGAVAQRLAARLFP